MKIIKFLTITICGLLVVPMTTYIILWPDVNESLRANAVPIWIVALIVIVSILALILALKYPLKPVMTEQEKIYHKKAIELAKEFDDVDLNLNSD